LRQLQRLQRLERLESLQSLQSLQSLERLERLESLEITNLSYEQVRIQTNSVIYCDPPYQDTAKYQKTIDYNKFYKWALDNPNPVFVSSYEMPKEFKEVASLEHRSILSTNNLVIEKLYWNGKNINYD
jgi:site-specific DNA-adenine methylase